MASTAEFVAHNLSALHDVGLRDPSTEMAREQPLGLRRRAGLAESGPGIRQVTLVEDDGVLRWEIGRPAVPPVDPRRGRRSLVRPSGKVVLPLRFEELEPSKVWKVLEEIDRKLSGEPELLVWKDGQLRSADASALDGKSKVLLIVHGTFSKAQAIVDGIAKSPKPRDFWSWANGRYDAIVFLNHHTLRVSPVVNALDLASLFDSRNVAVDAIGHSRGGLVLRWWLEALDRGRGKRRAILVGGTLGGTSLAAPPKLRAAIGLLTNVLRVVQTGAMIAAGAVPPLAPIVSLLKVLSLATNGLSSTPLVDAGVAVVPGLASMSRVGNNAELIALRERLDGAPAGYFAVRANFEPQEPAWKFWKHFRGAGWADPAADAIFRGENDLVVDTDSMIDLKDGVVLPDARVLDYGTQDIVHHLNYFEQGTTLDQIRSWFGAD